MLKRAIKRSESPEETEEIGAGFGSLIAAGDVIGLKGDLGSGKTCFVRGLARGLEIEVRAIVSPSFMIIAEHRGRLPFYHIDLYRLEPAAADPAPLREYLYGEGASAIEWVERLPRETLREYLEVRMIAITDRARQIEFIANGERAESLLTDALADTASRLAPKRAGQ